MAMAMDTAMKPECLTPLKQLSSVIFLCFSASLFAQQSVPGSASDTSGIPSASALSSPSSAGQSSSYEPVQGRTWVIKPRISLTETYSDNANINKSAGSKQSDFISELAPGIRIEASTARFKAYFDYALRGQFYAKSSENNRSQNSLNSFGTFEAIDKWLFLDFSGVIAQQTISAFGPQSTSNTTINNNSTEIATYRLSPYIRGQFGGIIDYSLRYNISTTKSDAATVSDIGLSQWVGQLRGSTPFNNLQWTVDGNQQTTDYSRGRKTEAELVRAMLTYAITPQFRLSGSTGQESNNYASIDQETHTTHGYGFDWTPTERTKLAVFRESRFFGNGHNINFSHRFPMSSITFTDTRDVSVLPNQFTNIGRGAVYDLYYQLYTQLYAANFPSDPSGLALAAANFANNQPGVAPPTSGFTTSQATIRRNQNLSYALFGARNSITFLANRSESQGAFASQSSIDPASQSSIIKQQGFGLNISHRLSEISNLNLLGSRQESSSSGITTLKTTTTLYQINISTKLGAKTTGSISARRSEFDSSTNPYTENALLGTVSFIY